MPPPDKSLQQQKDEYDERQKQRNLELEKLTKEIGDRKQELAKLDKVEMEKKKIGKAEEKKLELENTLKTLDEKKERLVEEKEKDEEWEKKTFTQHRWMLKEAEVFFQVSAREGVRCILLEPQTSSEDF